MIVQSAVTHFIAACTGAAALWLLKSTFVRRASGRAGARDGPESQTPQSPPPLRAAADDQMIQPQSPLDRLNIAIQAAGLSVWEAELPSGRFLWVGNPIRVFGLEELPLSQYSEALAQYLHPEDYGLLLRDVAKALAAGERILSSRFRLERAGMIRHMQTYAHVVLDSQGTPVRLVGATQDITNEVQAADLLQRQAEQERALFDRLNIATEAAGIVPWEYDIDGERFILGDPQAILSLHGIDPADSDAEEFLGIDRFFTLIHPDDRNVFTDALGEALKAGRNCYSCRYRCLGADGRISYIRSHARVVFDQHSRVRRLYGVAWNITEEISAAERLRQQAERLRSAERRLERASLSSLEGHWESNLQCGTVWFSSSYHALLGYENGELPCSFEGFRETVHPDDRQSAHKVSLAHVRNGTPFRHDLRLRMKNGDYRWFRRHGMAERDDSGRALSISGSIQDIHEQKLAEDALKLAQQRFERAINGTQDGLWELEANGTAWCSPRIGELLGYGQDELPSDSNFLQLFLHPGDAATVVSATRAHYEEGCAYDIEVRLRTKPGDYRWYRARATAERNAHGEPLRLSGSLQDVTEARTAREALLSATEQAEAANRAKSEFLANVSHEIRTPMNGIIGMTGLLLETGLDRMQRDYADTIRSSADSLLNIINDILDFSKIEAGKLDIEAIDLDLRSNVEDVATIMAFQAAAKNLELIVHVHPDVPNRVIGDPHRLRQCLLNMVGNAIKFTHQGEIVIEVSRVGRNDTGVLARFEVCDTGIGISENTLAKLFQPFVQADSSTTRHFGGTGLGLSIVRRLVEMMGGKIGARSKVGKGSTFWFELPLQPTEATGQHLVLDMNRVGRRVLVIDDNETNRRVIAGQLMHAGYEVSLAASGIEALSILHQAAADAQPFDVVLADHHMQNMDGATLGERINTDPDLSSARIVMLTSMDRHGDMQRFASLGFAAYLTKPVRPRELLACLDRVLARDSREWHMQSQPIITRGSLASSESRRRYGCSVLLVEDNAVNQKVSVRYLERMGCKVRVADNGAEALRAWRETKYDIVLMDLQMPVMDGLTATVHIRKLEGGGTRTPIVALTANAMSGQLERCLAAGMDGFLTKPLEIARLHETLERFGLGGHAAGMAPIDEVPATGATPVNLARFNEIVQDDPEFAHELTSTFISSGGQILQEIQTAFQSFDRSGLTRAAHKFKGAGANVHAERLRDLAYTLEAQAQGLDQPRLKELIDALATEFARAAAFLRAQTAGPKITGQQQKAG
ncbi:hypothetical protein ACG33_12875 [Steroidobacter denitrificans]|uniref:Sensory/regulatory protein RpfC n=1 Tax=Steroidobacter denitrificans TaxID=465721 RepID=A0A127FC35_STEDE|nr:PAS domain-containing protein [Steroidobacter denitrificans]AMN47974.1 hypothetical protein ACG33_12875 [Steroidobacter denitrificans]